MKILITGAAGGVGTRVTELLRERHDVVAVDRVQGTTEGVTWHVGDVTSFDFLDGLAAGTDVIIHLAGIPIFDEKLNNEITDINIGGTQRIFEIAAKHGVRRVVQASSICATGLINRSVHQAPPQFPVDETFNTIPDDMYGLSKLVAEQIAEAYKSRYGVEHTSFRMATVWVPDNEPINTLLNELLLPEYDNDLAYRDLRWQYLDVRDAATAFVLAAEAKEGIGVANLGASDNPGSDWRLWINHAYPEVPTTALPAPDDLAVPVWDISKARRELGFEPKFTWRDYPAFVEAFETHQDRLTKLAGLTN